MQCVCLKFYLVSVDRLERLVDIEHSDVIAFAGRELIDDFVGVFSLWLGERVRVRKLLVINKLFIRYGHLLALKRSRSIDLSELKINN